MMIMYYVAMLCYYFVIRTYCYPLIHIVLSFHAFLCVVMWYYKCLVGSDFQGAISSPTRLPTAGSRKAEEVCTWVVAR